MKPGKKLLIKLNEETVTIDLKLLFSIIVDYQPQLYLTGS